MGQGTVDLALVCSQVTDRNAQIEPVAGARDRVPSGAPVAAFNHYTLIFGGNVQEETERNGSPAGSAFMKFKCWASSQDEAMEMAGLFAKEFSFKVSGRLQVSETEPAKQPCGIPFGYDFRITPSQFAAMIV
jgi:hypothetical protein